MHDLWVRLRRWRAAATGSEGWWQVGDRGMITSLELAGEVTGVDDATLLVGIWDLVTVLEKHRNRLNTSHGFS